MGRIEINPTSDRSINKSGVSGERVTDALNTVDAEISTLISGQKNKAGVDTTTTDEGNITLSGEQTLNGLLTNASRILVTNQSAAADNGIYTTASGAWARATDYNESSEVNNGDIIHVLNSGSNKYLFKYLLVTPNPITVGVTGLLFEEHPDIEFASQSEVDTGTDPNKSVSPLTLEGSARFGQFKEVLSTGFIGAPPVLSINGGDSAKFDMTGGTVVHIDSSTYPATVTVNTISAVVAGTASFLATNTASFISINSSGSIQQRSTQSTPAQRRDFATVGLLSHPNNLVINTEVNTPTVNSDLHCQLADLMRALGFFSTGGNQVSGISASLTLAKSTGTGFSLSENADVNSKDPHNFDMSQLSPIVMFQILRDATSVTIDSIIDPTIYDDGTATPATVPANNNATISYIYIFPNNQVAYLLGQEVFNTFAAAKDAAGSEVVVVPPDIATGALLLARVILKKNASDIRDAGEALIIPSAAISSGGSTVTTLQQSYDISVTPEFLTDLTRGAVTFQDGTGVDANLIIEGRNNAGTTTFSLSGAGLINTSLTASRIIETDGSKNLIAVAKATAYNKAFGNTASTVCEGNDLRLRNTSAHITIKTPEVGIYRFRSVGFAGTIESLIGQMDAGTITVTVKIDGVNVTNIVGKVITTSESTTASGGAKTFAIGADLEFDVTAISSPDNAELTLRIFQTG